MAISDKQRAFLAAYLECWNASEAARRAGYSVATAGSQGSRLLKNVEISAEIERFKAEHIISPEEVQILLTQQARSDIGDFLTQNGDDVVVDLPRAVAAKKTSLIKKLSQSRTVRVRSDGETEETVSTTLELYDKQAAIVQAGKIHKLFTDRSEVAGPDGGAVTFRVIYERKRDGNPDPSA